MREILFRAKRKKNREWVEGYYFVMPNGDACIMNSNKESQFVGKVIPETVGQYTGLTDKNGKKIFEGDIVRVDYDLTFCDFVGYVDYADGSFRIVSDLGVHYRWIDYEVTVIGNIHDNPELLKGGNKNV